MDMLLLINSSLISLFISILWIVHLSEILGIYILFTNNSRRTDEIYTLINGK
jgi:hypothetical protein